MVLCPYMVAEPATYRTPPKETPTPAKGERQISAPVEDLFGEPSPPQQPAVEEPVDAEEMMAGTAESGGDESVKQAQVVGDGEGEGARRAWGRGGARRCASGAGARREAGEGKEGETGQA